MWKAYSISSTLPKDSLSKQLSLSFLNSAVNFGSKIQVCQVLCLFRLFSWLVGWGEGGEYACRGTCVAFRGQPLGVSSQL